MFKTGETGDILDILTYYKTEMTYINCICIVYYV